MPNAPSQTMTAAHQIRIAVSVRDRITGAPGDTTTPLVVTSNQPTRVTGVVDPNDNRSVILTATTNIGGATVTVQENPPTPNPLSIPVTVEAPPDLSGVDFVSASEI